MEQKKEYADYHIPIEEREKRLFATMKQLDQDSFALYSDIIDKKPVEAKRLMDLNQRLQETREAYDHLFLSELVNLNFASKRLFGKAVMAVTVSFYATVANHFLGITAFILLMNQIKRDYVRERDSIEKAIEQYHPEDLDIIEKTIQNCSTFMHQPLPEKPVEYQK